ncbi:MAG: polyribonucleotide nucleotidyltransferase [Patescibacteria group bacterium]
MKYFEDSYQLDDKKLTLQVGKLANASETSVIGRLGDTCVLVTINKGRKDEDLDYLPLFIEYVEKLYAGGKIKGSRWVKREGKPTDEAVLIARLIDRGVRPFFPKNYRKSVQIIITLLSVDGVSSPEILAAITTSAALHISSVPWNGPLATVRMGYVKAEGDSFILNPDESEQKLSQMDMIVTATKDKTVMLEVGAEELDEDEIKKGIEEAQKETSKIIEFIEGVRKKIGKPKEEFVEKESIDDLVQIINKDYEKEIDGIIKQKSEKEYGDDSAVSELAKKVENEHKEKFDVEAILKAIDYAVKTKVRNRVLVDKKRLDGRDLSTIRDIYVETSILPRTHGSAIFQRGDTQVLSIATLGSLDLAQLIESPIGEEAKKYIHHYFMPPYSLGEVGRLGFPSRREIGHGALAEKALEPVLPDTEDFPYTVRIASEVLSTNGSTSMASACGSSLALMDAGVPIKSAVAGIAMGLIYESDSKYEILTDIIGIEDFIGDMDFKVAGSKNGITAVQLDVKNNGLTGKMIDETLSRAKEARLFILEKMAAVIDKPRTTLSKFAPKVIVLTPPQEKIGEIIGPGGKNIKNIIAKTDTEINISSDGKVTISGINEDSVKSAQDMIESMIKDVEVDEEYDGTVRKILPFGAFVEILPGKEGLIHVSKMGREEFVKDAGDVLKVGQQVKVKVLEIDRQRRINLQLLQ